LEPSIGHRVVIFFHLLPSHFFKRMDFDHLKFFLLDTNCDSNLENTCSHNLH
jgi:hypothetical protein